MNHLFDRIWTLATRHRISFSLCVLLFASSICGAAQVSPSTSSSTDRTKVVILGSGTPQADPDYFGPAVAIVVGDAAYLVDCGVGVVRRAAAAERKGISALASQNIHV